MIPAEQSHMNIAAQSHPGMSGKINEDRYAVSAYRLDNENSLPAIFAIVSDGIGGHRAGEVAAEIIVETTSQVVASSDGSSPLQTLKESITLANQKILSYVENEPKTQGMGATCSCCLIVEDRLYIAFVGDSRIYLLRQGNIIQLSTDHTWIQEALDAGTLTPGQAIGHPNAHVIRRFLGSERPIEIDTRLRLSEWESQSQAQGNQGYRLRPGDQILLCSDGLTDLVDAHEIQEMMDHVNQGAAINNLIDLANQRGGHDNITIISIRSPEINPKSADTPPSSSPEKRTLFTCLTVGLLAVFGFILIAGTVFFSDVILSPLYLLKKQSVQRKKHYFPLKN